MIEALKELHDLLRDAIAWQTGTCDCEGFDVQERRLALALSKVREMRVELHVDVSPSDARIMKAAADLREKFPALDKG